MKYLLCAFGLFMTSIFSLGQSTFVNQFLQKDSLIYSSGSHEGPSIPCKNGDIIVTFLMGKFSSTQYEQILCLIRTTSDGKIIWTKTFLDEYYSFSKIIEDKSGNFVLFGRQNIVKFANNGELIWSKKFNVYHCFYEGLELPSGEIIVVGSIGNAIQNGFILKIDTNGQTLWERYTSLSQAGEYATLIVASSDNTFLIGGPVEGTPSSPGGVFVIKLDSEGNPFWMKNFFNAKYLIRIIKTGPNDYTLVRQESSALVLTNIDESGNLNWSKTISPNNKKYYLGADVATFGDNIYITGPVIDSFYSSPFILSMTGKDTINWMATYPTLEGNTSSISNSADGGFILFCKWDALNSPYYFGTIKTDSLGQVPCLSEIDYSPALTLKDGPISFENLDGVTLTSLVSSFFTPTILDDIAFKRNVICEKTMTENINLSQSSLFKIFPNPSLAEINITLNQDNFPSKANLKLEVTDAFGRKTFFQSMGFSEKIIIPPGILPPGYFVVSLISNGKTLEAQKLIVLR